MAEIVFDHVTKMFDGQVVLDDISFRIEKGEFVFVIGKSGAGKSTLLNLLTKQLEPTKGSVFVFGTPLEMMKQKELPYYRRRLGIMSQDVGMLNDSLRKYFSGTSCRRAGWKRNEANDHAVFRTGWDCGKSVRISEGAFGR